MGSVTSCSTPLKRSIIWLEETLSADWSKGQALRNAGVEAVYMAADMADNHGPFFNPEQMDRFILSYIRKMAEKLKEMGMYVMLHTDGDLALIL